MHEIGPYAGLHKLYLFIQTKLPFTAPFLFYCYQFPNSNVSLVCVSQRTIAGEDVDTTDRNQVLRAINSCLAFM